DVLLHRVLFRRALEAVPRLPLGAADHVAEAGLLLGVVAGRRLLVQAVDLQQRPVVGPLAEVLRTGDGGFESGLQVGHGVPRCSRLGSGPYPRRWRCGKVAYLKSARAKAVGRRIQNITETRVWSPESPMPDEPPPASSASPANACRRSTPRGCAWT